MIPQWENDTPIYLQLYQQVIGRIIEGAITEGEALPSVRKVAAEYQINPITISKAYQMLQEEMIVETLRGRGMFVRSGAQDILLSRERAHFLQKEWPQVKKQISRLQLSVEELLLGDAKEQERSKSDGSIN